MGGRSFQRHAGADADARIKIDEDDGDEDQQVDRPEDHVKVAAGDEQPGTPRSGRNAEQDEEESEKEKDEL